jgi:hypothetical protein
MSCQLRPTPSCTNVPEAQGGPVQRALPSPATRPAPWHLGGSSPTHDPLVYEQGEPAVPSLSPHHAIQPANVVRVPPGVAAEEESGLDLGLVQVHTELRVPVASKAWLFETASPGARPAVTSHASYPVADPTLRRLDWS